MNNLPFNLRPGARIMMFLLVSLVCIVIGTLVVSLVTIKGVNIVTLRIATVIQDVFMFILPAVLTAVIITRRPATLLRVDSGYPWVTSLLAVAGLLAAMPAMNALVAWNESISLPESLAGVERWMHETEEAAQNAVNTMLGGTSWGDLVVGILIVGVLAGFSEEIFFRGALQRILATLGGGQSVAVQVAIWGTAFIFSAFHVQFFGFFPRLLLGAYFGYLLWWSRSLWVPVTVHAVNNTLVVIATWLQKAGYISVDLNTAGSDSLPAIIISAILTVVIILFIRKQSRMEYSDSDRLSGI